MIQVEHLSKHYRLRHKPPRDSSLPAATHPAVDDVSFTCRPGRVFSLLGPNGAGKTTTLRMVATILQPTAGTIRVAGYDTVQEAARVRASIGFLTGSTHLYDRLTPAETVQYFARLHGMGPGLLAERQDRLFEQLGIHEFAHKRIGQLSTGMKQKVSIARTMIHDPSVVIFDEPTSGLDVITAHHIIELIRQCRQAGKTVIFSSHIMSEVDLLCDELAIINRGRLIYQDSMDHFRQRAGSSLTEGFIRLVQENNAHSSTLNPQAA